MKPITVEDKKKLANEKRLLSVKKWQKSAQHKNNGAKNDYYNLDAETQVLNKRVVFGNATDCSGNAVRENKSPSKLNSKINNKPALFDESSSSDSEDDEKYFAIKPQFEGEKGQHLLEMNSQFSERFKLDERFKEDNNDNHNQEKQLEEDELNTCQDSTTNERLKNLEILEQVLGYQVPGKEFNQDKTLHRKRLMRFDPDDENTSRFIAKSDDKKEEKKKRKKIEVLKDDSKSDIPISTERFFEVSSDLKTILGSSSGQFSLSQKFDEKVEDLIELPKADKVIPKALTSQSSPKTSFVPTNRITEVKEIRKTKFFISNDDPRLKEGVEFFMCPKPFEDIREEWINKSDNVKGLLRRKRKMLKRKPSSKKRISQRKHNLTRKKMF